MALSLPPPFISPRTPEEEEGKAGWQGKEGDDATTTLVGGVEPRVFPPLSPGGLVAGWA
jgi:hypothetical protein